MGVRSSEHTFLPGATDEGAETPADLGELTRLLSAGPVALTGADGSVALSAGTREALAVLAGALHRGQAVTVAAHEPTVTTQEAADVLGISRPTLVRLLDQGAIPFEQPCRHRRLLLTDVLAYRDGHRSPR